jgi:hypothetical protein
MLIQISELVRIFRIYIRNIKISLSKNLRTSTTNVSRKIINWESLIILFKKYYFGRWNLEQKGFDFYPFIAWRNPLFNFEIIKKDSDVMQFFSSFLKSVGFFYGFEEKRWREDGRIFWSFRSLFLWVTLIRKYALKVFHHRQSKTKSDLNFLHCHLCKGFSQ